MAADPLRHRTASSMAARELHRMAEEIEAHVVWAYAQGRRPQVTMHPPRTELDEYLELFEREFRNAIAEDFEGGE
jgi:hypothetical protein